MEPAHHSIYLLSRAKVSSSMKPGEVWASSVAKGRVAGKKEASADYHGNSFTKQDPG